MTTKTKLVSLLACAFVALLSGCTTFHQVKAPSSAIVRHDIQQTRAALQLAAVDSKSVRVAINSAKAASLKKLPVSDQLDAAGGALSALDIQLAIATNAETSAEKQLGILDEKNKKLATQASKALDDADTAKRAEKVQHVRALRWMFCFWLENLVAVPRLRFTFSENLSPFLLARLRKRPLPGYEHRSHRR